MWDPKIFCMTNLASLKYMYIDIMSPCIHSWANRCFTLKAWMLIFANCLPKPITSIPLNRAEALHECSPLNKTHTVLDMWYNSADQSPWQPYFIIHLVPVGGLGTAKHHENPQQSMTWWTDEGMVNSGLNCFLSTFYHRSKQLCSNVTGSAFSILLNLYMTLTGSAVNFVSMIQ